MNATKFLKQDHAEVRALFSELDATQGDERVQGLFDELEELLNAHTQIEEEIFYPAARDVPGLADLVEEALAEHHAVDILCEDLLEIDASDPSFRGKLVALRQTVLHHLEVEETQIFPAFEQGCTGDQLDVLGKELEARKDEILERELEDA
ncbi:MAG: hemerythrin domain-containing protein [Pseudomonadota bacterium]|nr:hemerythrin domain-containing protein [Pseudomonadota bacterium]